MLMLIFEKKKLQKKSTQKIKARVDTKTVINIKTNYN